MQNHLGVVAIQRDLHLVDALDLLGVAKTDVLTCSEASRRGAGAAVEERRLLMSSSRPAKVLRVGRHGGWTAVADGSGDVALDLEAWRRRAAMLGVRIVVARREPDEAELAVFDGFELRRLLSWAIDEPLVALGSAPPGEGLLHARPPTVAGFSGLLALWGVDLWALNERTDYAMALVRLGALDAPTHADAEYGAGPQPDRALGLGSG